MGRDALILMVWITLMAAFMLLILGCGTRAPCMTGFEMGVNAGTSHGIIREYNTHYGGVHATLYYDTTGACGPYEEKQ